MTDPAALTPTKAEHYAAFIQLTIHAESITWARFYNYLMGSSILALAWTTLFASTATHPHRQLVLRLMAGLGIVLSPPWAALGYRGREFLKKYISTGQTLETQAGTPSTEPPTTPLALSAYLRDKLLFGWLASRTILVGLPLLFTALYAVFLAVS